MDIDELTPVLTAFADRYTDTFYPKIADIFGRLFARIPFAIGEIMMYIWAFMIVLSVVFLIALIFFHKNEAFIETVKRHFKSLLSTFISILVIYIITWVIPFSGSVLGKGETAVNKEYSLNEVEILRNHITDELNRQAQKVDRDEDGNLIYEDKDEVFDSVTDAMKALSDEYPRLEGYYPPMKEALCSDVLDWMNIGGYTYPYTMEITYNRYISDLYYPSLFALESSHHQGYYKENEANFLAYLSCTGSKDDFVRYSGMIYIYSYVDKAYQSLLSREYDPQEAYDIYIKQPALDEQIIKDIQKANDDAQKRYEQDSHPMEDLSDTAKTVSDKGWSTQKKVLAENSYDGVVDLLLEYYDGKLY